MSGPAPSQREATETGLRRALAMLLALVSLVWLISAAALPDLSGRGWAVVGVTVGLWVAAAAGLVWTTAPPTGPAWVAVVAMAPIWWGGPAVAGLSPWASCLPGMVAVVAAAAHLGAFGALVPTALVVLALTSGGYVLDAAHVVAGDSPAGAARIGAADWWGRALLMLWPALAAGGAVLALQRVVRRAADRADDAVRLLRRSEVEVARAEARTSAHQQVQSLLHDSVAAALRAGATPGVSRLEARRAARAAVRLVEEASLPPQEDAAPVDLVPALRRLSDSTLTPVVLSAPAELRVPGRVATALLGSTAEALRNVDRHAHATHVWVELEGTPQEVRLVVRDDGAGFVVPARISSTGLHLSVVTRMRHVGGEATVSSRLDEGTRVTLTWHEVAGADRPDPPLLLVRTGRRLTAASLLPVLAMMGLLAGISWQNGHSHALTLAWGLVVGLIAAMTVRADHVPGWWSALSIVVGVGGLVLLVSIPARSGWWWQDERVWPVLAAGLLLLALALVRPRREALAGLVVLQVLLAVLAYRTQVSAAILVPVLAAPAYLVVVGLVAAGELDRLGTVAARASAAERAEVCRLWARSEMRAVRRQRLLELEQIALPMLRELASSGPQGDPDDLRRRAALVEQAVRDELHVPGSLDAAGRAAVRRAREEGCVVRFQADGTDGPVQAPVGTVVLAALGVAPAPRELTVGVYDDEATTRLSVVAVPGHPDRAAALRAALGAAAVVDDSPDATWAEMEVTPGRPADGQSGFTRFAQP